MTAAGSPSRPVTATKPFVGGEFQRGRDPFRVNNPWDDSVVAVVDAATPAQQEAAVATARALLQGANQPSIADRATILDEAAAIVRERGPDLAWLIASECGKPITAATREAARTAEVLRTAAEEARRWHGELLRLDVTDRHRNHLGLVRRVPLGPVLGITPANSPLNLVAHKVAPAIAVGAPIIVKPHPLAPLSALALADALAVAGLPPGWLSVLPGDETVGRALTDDARLRVLSFTGSAIGWRLKGCDATRKTVLELGGNAPVIVNRDADLAAAAHAVAIGATNHSGQSCISVQRLYVHKDVWDELLVNLVAQFESLVAGDPQDPNVLLGPPVDPSTVRRADEWVTQAIRGGASALTGGRSLGRMYAPTLLVDVPRDLPVYCEEVFAPVLCAEPVESIEEGFRLANASRYGLQAGVFTRDLAVALDAWRSLQYGGVVINETSDWRSDIMPYGGSKLSGTGREGVRYAMDEFTESRTLVLSGVPL